MQTPAITETEAKLQRIAQHAADSYTLAVDDVRWGRRNERVPRARATAISIACEILGCGEPTSAISEFFDLSPHELKVEAEWCASLRRRYPEFDQTYLLIRGHCYRSFWPRDTVESVE